jgi:hypothetical protein
MPKPKGAPKTGGRARGTPNKRTVDGEAYARALVEDSAVRDRLLTQARAGEMSADLIKTFLAYAFGKPVEVSTNAEHDSETRTFTITF